MRTPLDIPPHLIAEAQLYAPSRDPLDAVCHVLQDYPKVVGELRQLRRRVHQIDIEGVELDVLLVRLKAISREILEL
ncbi:MAG: hypothetical protein CVV09_05040 [Gammaproteobacteria bacterium HGW-Gammaproteobacteria-13]|nr:MAG: hypothetical protein CVV09_05040 [Gammaproteobacteria bacterium HGW-Gammaproteobacteria-13]